MSYYRTTTFTDSEQDQLNKAFLEAALQIGEPRLIRWVERLIAGDPPEQQTTPRESDTPAPVH